MASKAGNGFFHFFDWTRKSRNKLLADGSATIEERVQRKVNNEDETPDSQPHLIDEDGNSGVSNVTDNSDRSCASSATNEEGSRITTPGVVARLMGLESIPSSSTSRPCSTTLPDSGVLLDNQIQNQRYNFGYVILKSTARSRRGVELRSEKLPRNPIERFQMEALPPTLVKSTPPAHHRKLSLVRNPGSVDGIEPAVQKKTWGKAPSSASSPSPSKVRESRKNIATSQTISKPSESSRGHVQSVALRSSRSRATGKGLNVLENSKRLPGLKETTQSGAKEMSNSVSLAIQAKLNVQRKQGLSTKTRDKFVLEENEKRHTEQRLKFQSIDQTNASELESSASGSSNVHLLNKTNCPSNKKKLASKPSVYSQSGSKILHPDFSPRKYKVTSRLVASKKEQQATAKGSDSFGAGKGRFMLNDKRACKEIFVEHRSNTKRNRYFHNFPDDKQRKHIQQNVVLRDNSKRRDDNTRHGADVVSFTFKSPLRKSVIESQPPSRKGENFGKTNCYNFRPYSGPASDLDDQSLSTLRLNVRGGDQLGVLLEMKLRELASGFQLPYCASVNEDGVAASIADSIGSACTFDILGNASSDCETESILQSLDEEACSSNSYCSVTSAQVPCMRYKLQGINKMDCYCNIVDPSEGLQDQSPLSILDNSFSYESCYSENFENADGNRTYSNYSSVMSEDIVELDCTSTTYSKESEIGLSALSSYKKVIDLDLASETSRVDHSDVWWDELEYVKEILNNWEFVSDDLISSYLDQTNEILGPVLFEKLEENKSLTASEVDEKHRSLRRKLIFDAVNQYLFSKYICYFLGGYRMWEKGIMLVGKDLLEELSDEILGWNGIEDWMVDDLVDKDMSTRLGRWIDFEIEAFEAGVEIERWLFNALLDEFFADL